MYPIQDDEEDGAMAQRAYEMHVRECPACQLAEARRALATLEVVKALREMAETGATPINPQIFGAFVELDAFQKGAAQVLRELGL